MSGILTKSVKYVNEFRTVRMVKNTNKKQSGAKQILTVSRRFVFCSRSMII